MQAKIAGVAKYLGYNGMAEDAVHIKLAMVTGSTGLTSQTGTVGHHESNGRFEQAIRNGERADFDTTRILGSSR